MGGSGAPAPELAATTTTHKSPATVAAEAAWASFLTHALKTRLAPDKFADYAPLLAARHHLGPFAVADLFLRPSAWNRYTLDPRMPHYLQTLLDLKLVDLQAVLAAMCRWSSAHALVAPRRKEEELARGFKSEAGGEEDEKGKSGVKKDGLVRWESSFTSEEVIFYRLTKLLGSGEAIKDAKDGLEVSIVIAKWMMLFAAASTALSHVHEEDVIMGGMNGDASASKKVREDMENSRAAFIMLLVHVIDKPIVLKALGSPYAKGARKALSRSISSFIPSIMSVPGTDQVVAKLDVLRTQTLTAFEPIDKKKKEDSAEMDELLDETIGLENIVLPHLDIARSRAGLYIYLNAALIGRPLLDDSIYGYLHNRFEGDIQSTAIDLILASFDVLANAVDRKEGQKSAHLLRSYLINKVPLILATFAATAGPMYPFNSELCITTALGRVDTNTFPTLSSLFENVNSNPFTESVRSDFVTACCLHGLVPETSIDKLIGDYAYQTLPAGGRYVKDKLVQECATDHDRTVRLITELEKMEGNAGAVCQALTEILGRLCTNKETMTLKSLCSQLASNPLNLDVLLLFDKTASILSPLCDLLDNWRYENDEGEYQPVYEEFGSILLLLLAFVYRYNLSASDLGIRTPDSFVAKLLSRGQLCRPLDELNEQEKNQLNGWIHGLFDADGAGLADELLSSCPPQNLYLLVPTLFHHIVLAFSTGYLTEESLKTGIEYLVEPFLMPSLVTAIMYLSNCLWTDRPQENQAIIKILQLILKPSQNLRTESREMLRSVSNIVAKPLENGLRNYQRQNPKSQDVEPLLQVLRENIELSRRTGAAGDKELESWTNSSSGGLVANIKHAVHHLTIWSINQPEMPSQYTHRQLLVGLRMLGAKRILWAILEELKAQTEAASGSAAYGYDVAVALVCAPDASNTSSTSSTANNSDADAAAAAVAARPQQRRLSLRDALTWAAEEWKKVQKKDPVMAEIIVRLHQRVEKQMAPVALAMPSSLDDAAAAAIADALVVSADEAAAAGMSDPMALDASAGLPLDLGSGDLSLGDGGVGSSGGLDLGADDWGLGTLDGLDGWGDMDLT